MIVIMAYDRQLTREADHSASSTIGLRYAQSNAVRSTLHASHAHVVGIFTHQGQVKSSLFSLLGIFLCINTYLIFIGFSFPFCDLSTFFYILCG